MTQTLSFQVHPSYRPAQRPQIDRPGNRMYGIVAAMDVEATGHGICCDRKALEQLAKLANAKEKGIPGRFGHPGMSENATGRKVHLAYNWRVVTSDKAEDKHSYLLHDSLFMDAARTSPAFARDPVEYIMNMAEQHPEQFAESMVLNGDLVWTTPEGQELSYIEVYEDEEGNERRRQRRRPANALTKMPVLRPTELHFVDWVNDGALTHSGMYPMAANGAGMALGAGVPYRTSLAFSSIFTDEAGPNQLLDHLFASVDDIRQRFNIPLDALKPKVKRLLNLYIDARAAQEEEGSPDRVTYASKQSSNLSHGASPELAEGDTMSLGEDSMSTRRRHAAGVPSGPRTATQRQFNNNVAPAAATAESDLTENEALTSETETSLDQSTAILNRAEQMAAGMLQSGAALNEGPTLASATQVNSLQEQVDQHTDQLHELTSQLKKLSELLVKNMELTSALQRNLARTNGETVISQRVPVLGATGGLEGFQFQQPVPGAWSVTQQPLSTEQRQVASLPAGIDENSAEARTIRAQQRRANQTR